MLELLVNQQQNIIRRQAKLVTIPRKKRRYDVASFFIS